MSVDARTMSLVVAADRAGSSVGRKLDVINIYEAWQRGDDLPLEQIRAIARYGALPEITWEPWNPTSGAEQPDYTLAAIANGEFDGYISTWARSAKAYGEPLFLRFAHEMNGDWYPWSVSRNGGSPAQYVRAYRHVQEVFAANGAANVRWVWSPNVILRGDVRAMVDSFPGADAVDVIGVDGYNFGPAVAGSAWRSPIQLFRATLEVLDVLAPGVPIWINEAGSGSTGGDKAQWVSDLFDYLRTSRVSAVIWFDIHAPGEDYWGLTADDGTNVLSAARSNLRDW
ncbi:glycoside hydrolase family 26 protein [Nakamurella sp. GG22]